MVSVIIERFHYTNYNIKQSCAFLILRYIYIVCVCVCVCVYVWLSNFTTIEVVYAHSPIHLGAYKGHTWHVHVTCTCTCEYNHASTYVHTVHAGWRVWANFLWCKPLVHLKRHRRNGWESDVIRDFGGGVGISLISSTTICNPLVNLTLRDGGESRCRDLGGYFPQQLTYNVPVFWFLKMR